MNILIDLSILRHPYCGLGQIALNYGHWYATHADQLPPGIRVTLLVPQNQVGAFGQHLSYLPAKNIYRHIPSLMPRYDLWHSIHQLSPFQPRKGTPRILTIHDLNFLYEKGPNKQQRYLRRLQKECDTSSAVCFISRFASTDANNHLHLDTLPQHIIYNGVQNLTQGPQEQPDNIDPSRPFLLSIGVVKPKKNLHSLFPVMDILPDYDLVIAGNDSDPYARQLRSQLPSHPNIHIIGPVTDNQRRWLYSHCTALLMPSLSEGFGLPLIEAMQWGKPVFASQHTSLPEIGGTHACYFSSFDPQDMALTIRQGLTNHTPLLAHAAQQYAGTFSYENHMQQYWSLYMSLLQPSGNPQHPVENQQ